jgi:hypothetical protein
MYYGDLPDPGTNSRAPRVQNIWSLRKDFKATISVLASKQPAEEHQEEEAQDERDDCDMEEDPHEGDLVLL